MIDSERVAGMDSHCSTFSIAAGNGAVNPVFTATYAGFVNGETAAVLGGTLVFARAPGEGVGSCLITPSGLATGNYAIAFNTGMLTITAPAPLMLPLTRIGTTNS